jgi:hypothetical protein
LFEFKRRFGKIVMALGAMVLVGTGLVAGAAPASASTIPTGQLQICAQGNYAAFVHVLPVDLGGGATTMGFASSIQNPGSCWINNVSTFDRWAQVDVVGIRPDGSEFYITSYWVNSSVSGLGIGTQGTVEAPYVYIW